MSKSRNRHETWDDVGHMSGSDPAISVAWKLVRAPHPVLPDEDVDRIAAWLMQAVAAQTSARQESRRHFWRLVQRGAVAVVMLLVGAALLLTWLAADSLPGETLYPVKRGVEDARLALASDSSAVGLHVTFAERRLDECAALLADGTLDLDTLDAATGELNAALELLESGARSGADAARVFDLSVRAVRLAESAGARMVDDRAVLDALALRIHNATVIGVQTQQLNGFVAAPAGNTSDTVLVVPGALSN